MNDTREHILTTSLKLFLQKNFKEVTMKEIVTETGMSKGAFYHYFSSKEQVFEEVINFFYGDMMTVKYEQFSKESLRDFYIGYLAYMDRKMKEAKYAVGADGQKSFVSNHYMLIFDAMKILPKFREEHLIRQREEIRAWTEIVKIARKKRNKNSDDRRPGSEDVCICRRWTGS